MKYNNGFIEIETTISAISKNILKHGLSEESDFMHKIKNGNIATLYFKSMDYVRVKAIHTLVDGDIVIFSGCSYNIDLNNNEKINNSVNYYYYYKKVNCGFDNIAEKTNSLSEILIDVENTPCKLYVRLEEACTSSLSDFYDGYTTSYFFCKRLETEKEEKNLFDYLIWKFCNIMNSNKPYTLNFECFVDNYMRNTFLTGDNCVHEGFVSDEELIGTFTMNYEIDFDNEKINIIINE